MWFHCSLVRWFDEVSDCTNPLARVANHEDEVRGTFWEDRFTLVPLEDRRERGGHHEGLVHYHRPSEFSPFPTTILTGLMVLSLVLFHRTFRPAMTFAEGLHAVAIGSHPVAETTSDRDSDHPRV